MSMSKAPLVGRLVGVAKWSRAATRVLCVVWLCTVLYHVCVNLMGWAWGKVPKLGLAFKKKKAGSSGAALELEVERVAKFGLVDFAIKPTGQKKHLRAGSLLLGARIRDANPSEPNQANEANENKSRSGAAGGGGGVALENVDEAVATRDTNALRAALRETSVSIQVRVRVSAFGDRFLQLLDYLHVQMRLF